MTYRFNKGGRSFCVMIPCTLNTNSSCCVSFEVGIINLQDFGFSLRTGRRRSTYNRSVKILMCSTEFTHVFGIGDLLSVIRITLLCKSLQYFCWCISINMIITIFSICFEPTYMRLQGRSWSPSYGLRLFGVYTK